jgi:hypothetical protein
LFLSREGYLTMFLSREGYLTLFLSREGPLLLDHYNIVPLKRRLPLL